MEKVSWNTVNKNKMDLNKSKMKNIKAQLELEPDFPGVATPQSSEWIIYIISYAYNPFTAPLGEISPVQKKIGARDLLRSWTKNRLKLRKSSTSCFISSMRNKGVSHLNVFTINLKSKFE